MHETHRTWVPFILVGITILILAAFFAWGESAGVPNSGGMSGIGVESVTNPQEIIPGPTVEEYTVEMQQLLSIYDRNGDAGQMYESLLHVTVPAERREQHIEFIVAFGELRSGNEAAGNARLDLIRSELGW